MALTISDRGTGTHGSAASSVTPGGRTATIAAGSMGVLCINIDNAGANGDTVTLPVSATDSVGNVWTRRINQVGDFGVTFTGFEYAFYTSFITTAFLTTDTLTLTYSPVVSPIVKVWTWYEVSSGLGMNISYSTGGQIAAATAANASVTTGTIPVGDAVIALYAGELASAVTGDSDTTNGTWTTQQTAQTGVTTNGQRIASQGKVQTTTPSTQTYNVTVASGDRGAGYIVLHENYAQPEVATGTGTAYDTDDPDTSDGGAPKSVNAGLATGVGLASESGMAHSEAALGSGAALDASVHIKATAQFDAAGSVPTVVNWGAFTSGAGAPSVAHPASLAAGDLLVFFLTGRNTGIYSANTGAGWAEHPDSPVWNGSTGGTQGAVVHVFYKIAAGTESGSIGGWGGVNTEYVGRMGAFRGVNQTDPFNVTASNSTTGTASPASLPTAATTVANCLVIIALGIGTATAPAPGAMSNSILTSQTNVGSQNTTADNDAYLNIQHGINASAGLWGATTISKNTNGGYAIIGISVQSGTSGGGFGRAYDAEGPINAEVATGTGTANNPRAHVRPRAEAATGTGQAYDADISKSVAEPEVATGSGVAYDAAPSVAVSPEAATGTGEAYDAATPTEALDVDAEVATGTGAASDATTHVAPTPTAATGTGTAHGATGAQLVTVSFGLDAEIGIIPGTHDRTESHFGTQPDTTITLVDPLGPLVPGDLLSEALAYLYSRIDDIGGGLFGLDAIIEPYWALDAVILEEQTDSYGLDARIAYGGTRTLDAIIRGLPEVTFGLTAYLHDPNGLWNLVRTPMGGASASYTAISSETNSPPLRAADGTPHNSSPSFNLNSGLWVKNTAGAIGDWWQVTWTGAQVIDRVVIYDGSIDGDGTFTTARRFGNTGTVQFSDGSSVPYSGLNGAGVTLNFAPRTVTWFKVVSGVAGGSDAGLAEVEAYNTEQWNG